MSTEQQRRERWAALDATPTPPIRRRGRPPGTAAWHLASPTGVTPPWAITAAHQPQPGEPDRWRITARTITTTETTDPDSGTSNIQTGWTVVFDLTATTETEALDIVEWILSEAPTP